MANIKWKERFAQVYEDSGVKDKYNKFKGYMSNVAEKLNIPSFDEVKGKVSTYADSFTDKVKEGYVNAKTGFTNLKGDFADDGKLNYSNMVQNEVDSKENINALDSDPRQWVTQEAMIYIVKEAKENPDNFKQKCEQMFDKAKLHPESVNVIKSMIEDDGATYLEPMLTAWDEHEASTIYNVVGAGNSPISRGHKTWAEADAWRQANSPASNVVMEKQNTVMSEMESMKTNSHSGNIVEQQKEAESQKVSGKDSKESSFFDSLKDKVNSVSEQFKSRFSSDEKQSTNERGNESFFSDIFDKFKSNESEVQNDGM